MLHQVATAIFVISGLVMMTQEARKVYIMRETRRETKDTRVHFKNLFF